MQYGHIYSASCIMIKLKVMFWKLYTRIYFNVGTFNILVFWIDKEMNANLTQIELFYDNKPEISVFAWAKTKKNCVTKNSTQRNSTGSPLLSQHTFFALP